MKENKDEVKELYRMIVGALRSASDAGTWAFWRERFNVNHPDHIKNKEIENPTQFARVNFLAAKHLYCSNKDILDSYHSTQDSKVRGLGESTSNYEFFNAMKQAIEAEMTEQLEQTLTHVEPEGYWEGDEYLSKPNSDDIDWTEIAINNLK